MSIQHIAPGVAISHKVGAVYTPANLNRGVDPIIRVDPFPDNFYTRVQQIGEDIEIAPWGIDNLEPFRWLSLLHKNNIAPSLLNTQVNFALGERHYLYVEDLGYDEATDTMQVRRVPYRSEPLEAWIRKLDKCCPEKFFRRRAMDYYFSGNVFNRFVLARDPERGGIAYLDHIDSTQVRLERMSRGEVKHAYVCDDWRTPIYDPSDRDRSNTTRFKTWRAYDPYRFYKTIYHTKIYFPGEVYYGRQPWHSATNWIGFANRIPVWMNSNIENSYNIKYHITYPEFYFDYLRDLPEREQREEQDRVFQEFDLWLAGHDNVSKTFFTKGKYDKLNGRMMDSWRIEPVKNDVQDRAWLDAYKTSLGALAAGFDVNPNLANIPAEGKFSTSGSELRIAAQLHQALKVQAARAAIVEPVERAIRINARMGIEGFDNPDVKIGFMSRNIVTQDVSRLGITPLSNQPPPPDTPSPNEE